MTMQEIAGIIRSSKQVSFRHLDINEEVAEQEFVEPSFVSDTISPAEVVIYFFFFFWILLILLNHWVKIQRDRSMSDSMLHTQQSFKKSKKYESPNIVFDMTDGEPLGLNVKPDPATGTGAIVKSLKPGQKV